MSVSSLDDVQVRTQSWSHQSKHLASLFELVILLQGQINAMREEARLALNAANKAKHDAVQEVAIHNGSDPSSTDTGKRVAMAPITNRPVKCPRVLKEPLQSAAAVTKSFGPLYRTGGHSRRLPVSENIDDPLASNRVLCNSRSV